MKRFIHALLFLSFTGAVLSFLLLLQHHLPESDLGVISCGGGAVNSCLTIARSGYGDIFGFPLAALGVMAYLLVFGASLLGCVSGGEERYPLLVAALAPVAILMVAAVVPLSAIMIHLGVLCRLCLATYIVNILIGVVLAFSLKGILKRDGGIRPIYRDLVAAAVRKENRPLAVSSVMGAIFIILFIVFLNAYLGGKGDEAAAPDPRIDKFREYYHSLDREELSLPPSAMALGDPDAEIRIAVFTDFLCTACSRFNTVEKSLMARFPGKLRIEYYNFPLDSVCNRHSARTLYPNSCATSQAFLAAAERGEFKKLLEYHFSHYNENKSRLLHGDSLITVNEYFRERLGREGQALFIVQALSERFKILLHDETELGGRLGIHSVPTIFINGRRIEGVPDAPLLESVIADELR
ncbi:MAG: thioredoxin domain-containing protein [Spirochaetes bacterium]|nr:thioredoxin domain-containing protein [Spirochaetota bacterium]